jgi:aminoglycoside 6'-N-acetyltransferase I
MKQHNYIICKSQLDSEVSYQLLLLADENSQLVDAYRPVCQAYLLAVDELVCGVYLLRVGEQIGKITNIAVEPAYQGRGFGKALLRHAVEVAGQQGL